MGDVCMGDVCMAEEEEEENSLQRSLSIAFKLISFNIGQDRAFFNLGNMSTICMYVCMYVCMYYVNMILKQQICMYVCIYK